MPDLDDAHAGHMHSHEPNATRLTRVAAEIRHHLPYTIVSVIGSLALVALLTPVFRPKDPSFVFHVFHPVHVLLAAATTTAMFWIHDRKWLKAAVIGIGCSLPLCTLSDIVLPYLGGSLLNMDMDLHICAIEEPWIILPFAFVGVATGLAAGEHVHRSTVYSHAGHVTVSSMASMLYLVGHGVTDWAGWSGAILIILLVAVMVPCVASDLVLPLLFVSGKRCEHVRDLDEI